MSHDPTVYGALIAGIISFFSPCVLPLVPAYLSFLAGVSLEKMRGEIDKGLRVRVMLAAAGFVLGFSTVFILMGASATLIGRWLAINSVWLGKIAGLVIIILGIHMTGLIRIPFLMYERRMRPGARPMRIYGAYLIGLAFAFGWTPCVGPLLAGILALAGTRDTVGQGMFLLAVYSAGLGIPFLLTAMAVGQFMKLMQSFKKWLRWVEIFAGGLLIFIGVMILLGGMNRLIALFPVGLV